MDDQKEPAPLSEQAAPTAAPQTAAAPAPAKPQAGAPRRGKGPFAPRRKVCRFCTEQVKDIDYKQIQILRAFMTERGRILGRRITGNCAGHQRQLTRAVRRARNLALIGPNQ